MGSVRGRRRCWWLTTPRWVGCVLQFHLQACPAGAGAAACSFWPPTSLPHPRPAQEGLLTMAVPEDRPEVAAMVPDIKIPVVLITKVGRGRLVG